LDDIPIHKLLSELRIATEDRNYLLCRARLLCKIYPHLCDWGLHGRASRGVREALEINNHLLPPPPHHKDALITKSKFGHILNYEGNFKEAEKSISLLLEELKSGNYGHDSFPALLTSLGETLFKQSRFEEAKKVFEQALKDAQEALGPQSPTTLICLRNLGVNYIRLGNFDEAERLHREALKGTELVFGLAHPRTLQIKSDLARALRDRDLNASEEMQRQVSEEFEKHLGSEHPYTLHSKFRLAIVLHRQGRYEDAYALNHNVLVGREKLFGEGSKDTLQTIKQHALILRAQQKYEEAEKFYLRAYEVDRKIYGLNDPRANNILEEYQVMLKEKEELEARRTTQSTSALSNTNVSVASKVGNTPNALTCMGRM
jgi:tetratricopeptide (TPR) repeat protein